MDGFLSVGNNKNVSANFAGNENISLYQGEKLVYDGGKIKPGTVLFEGNANGEIPLSNLKSWDRIKNGIEIEFVPISNEVNMSSSGQKFACIMDSWFKLQGSKLRIPINNIKKGQISFDSKIPREKIESNDINYGIYNSIEIKYWENNNLNNRYVTMYPMAPGRGNAEIQIGRFEFKNDTLNYIPYSLRVYYASLSMHVNQGGNVTNVSGPLISSNIIKITAY